RQLQRARRNRGLSRAEVDHAPGVVAGRRGRVQAELVGADQGLVAGRIDKDGVSAGGGDGLLELDVALGVGAAPGDDLVVEAVDVDRAGGDAGPQDHDEGVGDGGVVGDVEDAGGDADALGGRLDGGGLQLDVGVALARRPAGGGDREQVAGGGQRPDHADLVHLDDVL